MRLRFELKLSLNIDDILLINVLIIIFSNY